MIHALKPTTVLANRIARIYPSLSAGHRRIADHVLSFPLESATASIEVLAERSGASNATVTRFVRALGYSSYGEFRVALSDALRLAMQPVDDFADARAMTESASGTFIAALRMQRANIEKAMNSLDPDSIAGLVAAILAARRIFIIASGASHHVASFIEDGLALYCEADVVFATARGGPERAFRHLNAAGPGDMTIAISVPRYSRTTVQLASHSKEKGATVVALTDGPTSPLAQIADFALFAPARSPLLPNSPTAVFALADALITAVARERPDAVEALKDLSRSLLWTFQH
jgi:DNA-binding MurR/RpiR family transcriptional regulator